MGTGPRGPAGPTCEEALSSPSAGHPHRTDGRSDPAGQRRIRILFCGRRYASKRTERTRPTSWRDVEPHEVVTPLLLPRASLEPSIMGLPMHPPKVAAPKSQVLRLFDRGLLPWLTLGVLIAWRCAAHYGEGLALKPGGGWLLLGF